MRPIFLIFGIVFLLLNACSSNSMEESKSSQEHTKVLLKTNAPVTITDLEPTVIPEDRKIIKSGEVVFETNNVSETEKFLKSAVKQFDAFIAMESIRSIDSVDQNVIEIRVPAVYFDALLSAVSIQAGSLIKKEISSEDVTEEYVDTESRIRSEKQLEARYFELLKNCKTIDEMLKMEAVLLKVRTAIEVSQGRLNYIDARSNYSTLRIIYYEPQKNIALVSSPTYFDHIKSAFNSGWIFVQKLSIGLITIWPLLIFTGAGLFIVWRIRRTKMRKGIVS
mgnify:CR=1 FL=1